MKPAPALETGAAAETAAARLAANRRGIVAMLLSMAFFVTNDTFMKMAREELPAGQVMAVRGVFAAVCTLALVIAFGELRRWRLVLRKVVLLRGLLELAVAICFIVALGHLPIADITAMGQSAPLLLAAYVALTGEEQMGWRRWLAIIVGFLGVLMVVKPGSPSFDIYGVLGCLSAVLVAARDLVTRRVHHSVPTVLILATTTAVVAGGGSVYGLLTETWQPVSWSVVGELALAGIFVTLGHYCVITAFRGVDIAVVSPFRYAVILFAAVYGVVVFGDIPDLWSSLGAALIAGSGLYTLHRERIRHRNVAAMAAKNPPPG